MRENTAREYGQPPFQAIVLHGGPGAPGCAAGLCRGVFEQGVPVLEHLQIAHTIDGLIDEVFSLMNRYSLEGTILIGHSFGTWLALLFAHEHPTRVQKLILTGCAPLEARYLQDIIRVRETRKMQGIDTDSYAELPGSGGDMLYFNEEQHKALMAEASALRESGELLNRALQVTCPVIALHGAYDPHPVDGIRVPLQNRLPRFRLTVLKQCGHDPWKEMYARETFFDLIRREFEDVRSQQLTS